MANGSILNFKEQSEQMLEIIENNLKLHQRDYALQILALKFRTLFEQGVASGRIYERDGISPYLENNTSGTF